MAELLLLMKPENNELDSTWFSAEYSVSGSETWNIMTWVFFVVIQVVRKLISYYLFRVVEDSLSRAARPRNGI